MDGQKTTIGRRLVRLCNADACGFFLLFLFLLAFSWPYVSFVDHVSIETLFEYLFMAWLFLIVMLVLMDLSGRKNSGNRNNG